MARNIKQIAEGLGAEIIAQVPDAGGAFGAARLAHAIASIQSRLTPGQGRRPGRPTNAEWSQHPKVPMSEETKRKLTRLAEQNSIGGRKVSPMQIAAQILEDALAELPAS